MSEKQNDAKHSPTPWRVTTTIEGFNTAFEGADGWWIGACSMGWQGDNKALAEANAAYIVEAVNAHERLVEELGDANEYIEHLKDQLKHYERMVCLVRRMIRPTETALSFAVKEGDVVKWICGTEEAEKKVDKCIAALQDLLAEARAAIGEEAGND